MMYVLAALAIWCVVSFGFFWSIIGHKYRKDKWYDWPLLAPVVAISTVATWVSTLFGWNK